MARLIVCFLFSLGVAFQATGAASEQREPSESLTIALLHLDIQLGDLAGNIEQLETAIEQAAAAGADWVMTPELSLTGYRFEPVMGLDWLKSEDPYRLRLLKRARELDVTLFLSHIERDSEDQFYNTLFVIDQGEVIGRHRKINTIPISESWSTPGKTPTLVTVDGVDVGLLICADAWPTAHAAVLKKAGADLILSSANWPPGEYGPGDSWEQRSLETGLPLIVNNRTGLEERPSGERFDMREGRSVVVQEGERVLEVQSDRSRLVLIRWDRRQHQFIEAAEADIDTSSAL